MDLKYHSVVIFVSDIETAKHFYLDALGQEMEYDFGKNVVLKSGISLWEILEGHVIEVSGNHDDIKTTKAYELYFETGDLERVQQEIARLKLTVLHDLIEEPWGQRTIRFYDPDNNLIEVGETMESFVRRFSESGMKPEEISDRTTIPLAIVRKILDVAG